MKISGVQKTSLIDYPGKIVSIIFTQGCNFKCPYCHNSELIPMKSKDHEYFSSDYIFNLLNNRKKLIDGISITGGEPTLQKDLYDFINKIKEINLKVKLDTNGSNPDMLKKLIENKLIDYIAMDIKGPLDKYKKITFKQLNIGKIIDSISLIQSSKINYEFRTTVVPEIHKEKDIKKIAILLKGSEKYFIQNFKANNTYNPNFMRIDGFPPDKLEEFKKITSQYIKKVKIRD